MRNILQPATLLIVDDNEAKRYVAVRMLQHAGYRVIEASTGKEAIEKAVDINPDLMIVDIKLPDLDGFEVCKIIKNNAGTAFIPVLHYSATYNTTEARVQGLEDGADAFLTQNAKPEELLATIKALLRMRQAETSLRRRNERLEILSRVSESIIATNDPVEMLDGLFNQISDHLGVDAYSHYILKPGEDRLLLVACAGVDDEIKPILADIDFDFSMCGTVARNKKSTYLPFVQASNDPAADLLKGIGLRAYVSNPLMAGDRLIGILSFGSRTQDEFTADEREFVHLISHYVALHREKMIMLQSIQAASRRKDEFLANMSHEIRTPMNAIIGLSHILSLSSPITEKQKLYIGTLQKSADSLLGLINDLLDIAKIESDSIELEQINFNLPELLQDIERMMLVKAGEKNLTMVLEIDRSLMREFTGDPTRLKQVILNLISNAIKFTEEGSVIIRARPARSNENSILVVFEVQDTGIGIEPNNLEKIFSKFSQADVSTTRKFGGTGLGLAIAKALIELMKGTVDVESEVGKGSKFIVTLPLEHANSSSTASGVRSGAPKLNLPVCEGGDKPLILLAEDNEANRLVAGEVLSRAGYEYMVAETGSKAIEMMKQFEPDLILMDVQMPELDGYQAARAIRAYEQDAKTRTPIIGVTAFASEADREKCLEAGMDDYTSKPFNHDDLIIKIENMLGDRKAA